MINGNLYCLASKKLKLADILLGNAVKQCRKLTSTCFLITVALSKAALKKLSKEKVINLAFDYQRKFDSTLVGVRNKVSGLQKNIQKLESGLAVSEHVTRIRVINIERKCWSIKQYY